MPHFLTLSSFSTATPRETSSAELAALWFDEPEATNRRQQKKNESQWCPLSFSLPLPSLHGPWQRVIDSGEMAVSDTCLLLCVLMSKSAGCRLAVRKVNASGFHANVWNEHGTDTGWRMRRECGVTWSKKSVRENSSRAAECCEVVLSAVQDANWTELIGHLQESFLHARYSCNVIAKEMKMYFVGWQLLTNK